MLARILAETAGRTSPVALLQAHSRDLGDDQGSLSATLHVRAQEHPGAVHKSLLRCAVGNDEPAQSSALGCTASSPHPLTSTSTLSRLSVRYADRTSSTRSRTLPAATARTRQLTATPYELYDLVGLQRARVRGISLRPQDLRPVARDTEQLTLEPDDYHSRAVEAVTDRARPRYGPGALRPAALASRRIRRA
ncbi:hypothetical protein KPP03845_107307 [Streptomyces xanthophaeus]|uniref:DinB/UmuC family translesion DNA polymerase n=1 Tax=Streptomyces xanthophaeus TaxID=67385 RepID=UPI00233F1C05|nr:hypothetical protein [Streptomyces xanthophaeus]WCD90878.1 hypothetical protein KPP03845_107307 [Streptomyces xanthophaeus]